MTTAELDAMDVSRVPRVTPRIHAEVAVDHQVGVDVVQDLHSALMRGWRPSHTHPLRAIAIDLQWHRSRGTIL